MPIKPVNDPKGARAIARAAFAPRPIGGGSVLVDALRGLVKTPEIGALALFNLPLQSLLDGQYDDATETGWRYLRLFPGANDGEVVEVRETAPDSAEFATYSTGKLAGRMRDVGQAAADLLADAPDEYEARILRLPEIHMEALWLHAHEPDVTDRFFGLPSTQKHLIDDAFIETAMERARTFLAMGGDRPAGAPRDLA